MNRAAYRKETAMRNDNENMAARILESRRAISDAAPRRETDKVEEEGGCGVTGFACSIPVAGRHIHAPSVQMHNRGNGKGGGIAAVGLSPDQLGVSRDVLDTHYLLLIAAIDPSCVESLENKYIRPNFDIASEGTIDSIADWRDMPSLLVQPPQVRRYFVRVKPSVLNAFAVANNLESLERDRIEDEFVYQNSYRINTEYYAALGEKQAFVLSHGKNMMILKIVGYAEEAVEYYKLNDFKAHVWIAHQRYPTRGRVWHPAGAHPFIGMHEALVHNGDFANYFSVSEYLKQRNIRPLFLTDTEVSVLEFDLLNRVYRYPLEYIIESLAPTTESDFDLLPSAKQKIYRRIQAAQIHGSPDGPWFFIIARNLLEGNGFQLLGITDTAMLRPQVFAIHDGEVKIGLVCSEKQAIDATLRSLASEDSRVCPVADKYWNARGGSSDDGGSFSFTLTGDASSSQGMTLVCRDKFGKEVATPAGKKRLDINLPIGSENGDGMTTEFIREKLLAGDSETLSSAMMERMPRCNYDAVRSFAQLVAEHSRISDTARSAAIEILTTLNDMRYPTGSKMRSSVLQVVQAALDSVFKAVPQITGSGASKHRLIEFETRDSLRGPASGEDTLVINAAGFQPELDDRDSKIIIDAFRLGWRKLIVFNSTGQRFHGVGLGSDTTGVRIDCYGNVGDYLGSGMDGLEIRVHGDAQDQLCQIAKSGKLVVYGSVGQTFMYGAKGSEAYIMGNAAGRPLINAVGKPRVVINGTCLDYLAESFMAGDPLNGGGFAIVNGLAFDDEGNLRALPRPYPGGNLFSLASGGAIYLRDPHSVTSSEQLNGGVFFRFTEADWALILPYLRENERLFGVSIERDLLTVNGILKSPLEVYRKVGAVNAKKLVAATGGVE